MAEVQTEKNTVFYILQPVLLVVVVCRLGFRVQGLWFTSIWLFGCVALNVCVVACFWCKSCLFPKPETLNLLCGEGVCRFIFFSFAFPALLCHFLAAV